MQDLNDLYYFVQVVDHGGFAPASRAIGQRTLHEDLDQRLRGRAGDGASAHRHRFEPLLPAGGELTGIASQVGSHQLQPPLH